jgi:regulator of RNase E activity RraA
MDLLTEEQIATLAKVDSPTVANVIELFDIRSRVAGYSSQSLKAVYPKLAPVAGYAVTSTFRSAHPGETGEVYRSMPQIIVDSQSVPAPRIMVFQDLDDPPKSATYGEVMVKSFQKFGFTGLITSGAGRDVEQVRGLNFPCWASSIIVAHGYCRMPESNVPVVVGGLQVRPGDLLHADANGIVNIPHSIAAEVVELLEPFLKAEDIVLDYLNKPNPTPEGYTHALDQARGTIEQLRERATVLLKSRQ